MSNQGKRMVKENLIAQIGQGTEYTAGTGIDITEDVISVDTTAIQEKLTAGDNITIADGVISATDTTYTAGTGIDITSNTISVDSTIVTDDELNAILTNYAGKDEVEVYVEYTKSPADVLAEMQAEDPDATLAQATVKWCKEMPVLVGRGASTFSTLEAAGYTNLVNIIKGNRFRIKGYYALPVEAGSSGYAFQNQLRYFTTDAANVTNPGSGVEVLRNALQSYLLYNFRLTGTTTLTETDPYNNSITIYGGSNNQATNAEISIKSSDAPNVRQISEIIVSNPVINTNYSSQLQAPTADGTYTLKVTVSSGVVTFS